MKMAIVLSIVVGRLGASQAVIAEQLPGACGINESECADELFERLQLGRVDAAIKRHQSESLAVVPAGKGTVADVFRRRHLHIAQNSGATCGDMPLESGVTRPGCLIWVFVSRERAFGQYSELA